MKYLQPLAIVVLLAIAVLDHWPTGDTDAATPMSRYATKAGVCKMVQRLDTDLPPWFAEDKKALVSQIVISLPSDRTCASLFR